MPHKWITFKKPAERPTALGKPVLPSGGGHGEVKSQIIHNVKNVDNAVLLRNIYRNFQFIKQEVDLVSGALDYEVLPQWDMWYDELLAGNSGETVPDITMITLSNMKFDFSDYVEFPE